MRIWLGFIIFKTNQRRIAMSDLILMKIDGEEVTIDVLNGQTKDKKKVVVGFEGNTSFRKVYPTKVFDKMKKDAIEIGEVDLT